LEPHFVDLVSRHHDAPARRGVGDLLLVQFLDDGRRVLLAQVREQQLLICFLEPRDHQDAGGDHERGYEKQRDKFSHGQGSELFGEISHRSPSCEKFKSRRSNRK
jgi:hypothetical protein